MADAISFDGGLTLAMPVTNLDLAIKWYSDILACELLYRMDEIAWCELSSPVARVNIGLSAVESVSPGGATATFGVADISLAKQALEDNNVRLDGDVMTIDGMVKLLTFFDPDGNTLMLYQDLKSNG